MSENEQNACFRRVFVVDSSSFELILLPSDPPLFQKTVFAADSFFSAPIFPLPAPLFQKLFVFHGMPFVGLTLATYLARRFSGVSVSLRRLSASLRFFKSSSFCFELSAFFRRLSASLEFLERSSLAR